MAARQPEPYDHLFKLLLVGDAAVGKSRSVRVMLIFFISTVWCSSKAYQICFPASLLYRHQYRTCSGNRQCTGSIIGDVRRYLSRNIPHSLDSLSSNEALEIYV